MPRIRAGNANYIRLWKEIEAEMDIQSIDRDQLAIQLGVCPKTLRDRIIKTPEKMTLKELETIWRYVKIPRDRLIDNLLREK